MSFSVINVPLAERLRKALGTGVIECITLLQMKNTLLPAEEMDYCVFIEKTDPTLNIPAIMHLHKTFQNIYIVLIAPGNDPGGEKYPICKPERTVSSPSLPLRKI